MTETVTNLSLADRARISFAAERYDLWLDLKFVPGKERRQLRKELKANLSEAASDIGASNAIHRLGSLREMAKEAAVQDRVGPRWYAGLVCALIAFTLTVASYMVLSAYYIEGILDSGVAAPVSSTLFPFFGSEIVVDPSEGLSAQFFPGPLPLVLSGLAFLYVGKPWRVLRSSTTLATV